MNPSPAPIPAPLCRASAALSEKGQKVGALRYANLDVKQIATVLPLEGRNFASFVTMEAGVVGEGGGGRKAAASIGLPEVRPEKITVSATVQCAFQIL